MIRLRWYSEANMNTTKPAKSQYSEIEAAAVIGVSVEELRNIIQQHITGREETAGDETKATSFRPSDLALLKILARQHLPVN
jgi:hypothetical protein